MVNDISKNKILTDLSIVMANYNGLPYLKEAITSIINSSLLPQFVIVVDDGSEDESIPYLQSLKDEPNLLFQLIIHSSAHNGVGAAKNMGISLATTKYIMNIDADDIIHPDKIKEQYTFLETHPDVDLVGTNSVYIDIEGRPISRSSFPENHAEIIDRFQRGDFGILDATSMFRNIYHSKLYDENFGSNSDYMFFMKLYSTHNFNFHNILEEYYYLRIHPQSLTSNIPLDTIQRKHSLKREKFGITNSFREKIIEIYDFVCSNLWKKALTYKSLGSYKYIVLIMLLVVLQPQKVVKRLSRLLL